MAFPNLFLTVKPGVVKLVASDSGESTPGEETGPHQAVVGLGSVQFDLNHPNQPRRPLL